MNNSPNFCPKCGSPLTFNGTFCPSCGSEIQTILPPSQSSGNLSSGTFNSQSKFPSVEMAQTSFPSTNSSQIKSSQTTIPQKKTFSTSSSQTRVINPQTQIPVNSPILMNFADLIGNSKAVSDQEVEDLFTKSFNPGSARTIYCCVVLFMTFILLRMGMYWGGLGICMILYFYAQYSEENRPIIHNRPEAAVRGFYMRFLKKKYVVSVYSETKILFSPSNSSKMYLPILFTLGNDRVGMRAMKQHIKQFEMIKKKF